VVTQPDRPKGRGMKLVPPPVKFLAEQLDLPLRQPKKVRKLSGYFWSLSPDLIVVVAYGEILTRDILCIPKIGCINLHASLLPELRGPEPIPWSIISGKEKTGLTTMWMDAGVDTGDIILQKEIEILPEDTKGSLGQKMSLAGAELLSETLRTVESGKAPGQKQVREPSFAPMIKNSGCLIDWSKPAIEIHNLVRGLNPSPSAYTFLEGKRLKIHKSKISSPLCAASASQCGGGGAGGEGGKVVEIRDDQILVSTGKGVLSLLELQPEGKRVMSVKDYLSGHAVTRRMKFTNLLEGEQERIG